MGSQAIARVEPVGAEQGKLRKDDAVLHAPIRVTSCSAMSSGDGRDSATHTEHAALPRLLDGLVRRDEVAFEIGLVASERAFGDDEATRDQLMVGLDALGVVPG